MGSVINLTPPDPLIWVCDCGCTTFRVYSDQSLQCAQCDVTSDWEGTWVSAPIPKEPEKAIEALQDVAHTNGPAEFVLRRALKEGAEKIAFVILGHHDGRTVTWSEELETEEQEAWLDRQLATARGLIVKGGKHGKR